MATPPFSLHLFQYQSFNRCNVPAHGILGGNWILLSDCIQNPPMIVKRFLQAAFHLEGSLPALPKVIHKNIENLQDNAVSGSLSDRIMELGVLVDRHLSSLHLRLLKRQYIVEMSDLFLGRI